MNNKLLTEIRTRICWLNGPELNEIIRMVRDQRKIVNRKATGDLWNDKPVSFKHKGHQFFGRIIKVNRKNSKVLAIREDQVGRDDSYTPVRPSEWTVPNTMLEHAPEFNDFDSAGVQLVKTP